jgi:hypothetical protein
MIQLTSAEHGGASLSCGGGDHATCGPSCDCGCPYTGLDQRGDVEPVADVERRYPNEWLAFVIPPGEDDNDPERALLVVHSPDDQEVWDAVRRITHNQVVHVYFNGDLDTYLTWVDALSGSP